MYKNRGIFIFELSLISWVIVVLCAIFIGFSKSGLPNSGILVVTVLMFIFPAKESIGILLPMLIVGDIFAVIFYRRSVVWKYLISLMPWVLLGTILGFIVLNKIDSDQLKPIIGSIVLIMIIIHVWRNRLGERFNDLLPQSKWFTSFMGISGGFTSMVGNAAGGIMTIYFLVKNIPKREFVGTSAWFFLIVNLIKVPFYVYLGLINSTSLSFNAWLVLPIILGAYIGSKVLPFIPQKVFQVLILALATFGAVRLLF